MILVMEVAQISRFTSFHWLSQHRSTWHYLSVECLACKPKLKRLGGIFFLYNSVNYGTLTEKIRGLFMTWHLAFVTCLQCVHHVERSENRGHFGRFFLYNMHSDQMLVNIMGILQTIDLRMLTAKIVAGLLESDNWSSLATCRLF